MKDLDRAMARARRLYPRSKHFRNAYMKGVRAALVGLSENACPYKRDPAKTWLAAYRAAWLRGYQSAPRR